jgi:hypothetical protein
LLALFLITWLRQFYVCEATLLFANWSAPAVLLKPHREAHYQLLGYALNDSKLNLGLALMPIFSYKSNDLWLAEHAVNKNLMQQGISVDRNFTLMYGKKQVLHFCAVFCVSLLCLPYAMWGWQAATVTVGV